MIDPKTVPHFTLNSGAEIPCIGMGTFGSDRVSPDDVAGAVAGALRAGYRLLDCAACWTAPPATATRRRSARSSARRWTRRSSAGKSCSS